MMNLDEYIEDMKKIQEKLLDYLEENTSLYENIFEDNKLHENQYFIISILHLILKISNDYHRHEDFSIRYFKFYNFSKI